MRSISRRCSRSSERISYTQRKTSAIGQVANQVPRTGVDARGVMVDDQKIKAILE